MPKDVQIHDDMPPTVEDALEEIGVTGNRDETLALVPVFGGRGGYIVGKGIVPAQGEIRMIAENRLVMQGLTRVCVTRSNKGSFPAAGTMYSGTTDIAEAGLPCVLVVIDSSHA